MNRRRLLLALSIILLLLVFRASALPIKTKHIQGFHVVKNLPLSMVAGETVEWQASFINPKSEEGLMDITLEIVEEETSIGKDEFTVEGLLESYDNPPRRHHYETLNFMETEAQGGVFQCQAGTEERFNIITLTIFCVPNLMPGTYTFTLTVTLQYED